VPRLSTERCGKTGAAAVFFGGRQGRWQLPTSRGGGGVGGDRLLRGKTRRVEIGDHRGDEGGGDGDSRENDVGRSPITSPGQEAMVPGEETPPSPPPTETSQSAAKGAHQRWGCSAAG
jgi:hypothetical protein